MATRREGEHGGADTSLRDMIFRSPGGSDPLNLRADLRAGDLASLVGIAAYRSIERAGQKVRIADFSQTLILQEQPPRRTALKFSLAGPVVARRTPFAPPVLLLSLLLVGTALTGCQQKPASQETKPKPAQGTAGPIVKYGVPVVPARWIQFC